MSAGLNRRAAVAVGVAALLVRQPVASAAELADAELIRACADYVAAVRTYNADAGYLECDDDPLWLAVQAAEARLDDLEAQTLAGVRAEAEVALFLATDPDGTMNFSTSYTGDWPERVVRGLLRLLPPGRPT